MYEKRKLHFEFGIFLGEKKRGPGSFSASLGIALIGNPHKLKN